MSKILIIFPTPFEAEEAFRLAGNHKRLSLGSKIFADGKCGDITMVVSGMSCKRANDAVAKATRESSPDFVILCGYCGACTDKLNEGDFIYEGDATEILADTLGKFAKKARIKSFHKVADAREKRQMNADGYDAVEMESDGFFKEVKRVCPSAKLLHIRCVSDGLDSKIPADFFNDTMSGEGGISGSKTALKIIKNPSLIIPLIGFARSMTKVGKIYADGVDRFMRAILR